MVQGPSWAADWLAASQEIPRISRNPKVHYRTHKRPPPVPISDIAKFNCCGYNIIEFWTWCRVFWYFDTNILPYIALHRREPWCSYRCNKSMPGNFNSYRWFHVSRENPDVSKLLLQISLQINKKWFWTITVCSRESHLSLIYFVGSLSLKNYTYLLCRVLLHCIFSLLLHARMLTFKY